MKMFVIYVILISLISLLTLLFTFNIVKKLYIEHKDRRNADNLERIKPRVESILNLPEEEFTREIRKFARDMEKARGFRDVLEEYIMDTLEKPSGIRKNRLIALAREMNYTAECIEDIKNRNPKISAMGSRKAGLYHLTEAIEDMLKCLDFVTNENQFEILVAFARIGKADPMLRAFDKIQNSIIINERAAVEILTLFPNGDEKRKLFRTVISGDIDYITTLFLRSVDKRMAELLVYDIVQILFKGRKEVRVGAMKALANFGPSAPGSVVIMAMEDTEWEVRAVAAKALGLIKIPEAAEVLYKALFDRQWWVRQNAANALANHKGYEDYFKRAAETGDKFSLDSIINALENRSNTALLEFFIKRREELININEEKK